MGNTQLAIAADGTVAFPLRLISGAEAVAVQLRVLLESIRGHWPEDQTLGIPWTDLNEDNAPDVVYEGYIREQLARIPEITQVRSVSVDRSAGTMVITVRFTVTISEAEIAEIQVISGADYPEDAGSWYQIISRSPRGLVP